RVFLVILFTSFSGSLVSRISGAVQCYLPERARELAVQSISDWKNYYPKECDECTQKPSCAGYFSSSKGRFHQSPRPIL
ncbi:TPA: hypothetical protein ACI7JD_004760, partial [Escherichia coli]